MLHARIEALPDPGPRWICEEVQPNYGTIKGSSNNRAALFYRSPLLAIQSLLDRPTLLEHMVFAPHRTYQETDAGQGQAGNQPNRERIYTEMSTGNWWWRTQVCLNEFCLVHN